MRLDHLLSKEKSRGCITVEVSRIVRTLEAKLLGRGDAAHSTEPKNERKQAFRIFRLA